MALDMMRGVVYSGIPYNVTVQDLPIPTLQAPTDAIVRITTAAICGSDLHMYHGVEGGTVPWGMGHEAIGYISDIGDAVSTLELGNYVVIPDNIATPHVGGNTSDVGLDSFGSGANLTGLQAEYARVPYADANLLPLPLTKNTTTPAKEQDFLTLSDIFPTGWTAIDYSNFQPGDTVAVFGAGPVGLLAAYSAILRGASRVYSVDHVPMRLERAASIGAVPINFFDSDPVEQILRYEPEGVTRAVDCVGMEAINSQGDIQEDIVINNMVQVTAANGGIGQIGVFLTQPNSTGAPRGSTLSPNISFPISDFFEKRLTFASGVVNPKELSPQLLELINSDKAHPNFIKSAEIGIEDAPNYYQRFDQHEELKVYIRFP